jgi:acyl-CoA thioesterase
MADFERDTRVEGGGGVYTARVDPAWSIWLPNGGYLIATALRAAGAHSAFPRPLSLACHFLASPGFGPIEIAVATLRRTRTAESMRLSMRQGEQHVLELLAWTGASLPGLEHADARIPAVPSWQALPSTHEIEGALAPHPHWQNLEQRPVGTVHWQSSGSKEPRQRDWVRIRELDALEDPFLDAGRLAVILDTYSWPAAAQAHVGDPRFIAPTLSLAVDFHAGSTSPWVLSDAYSPLAAAGSVALESRVWDPGGALLATAIGTLRCRPRPAPSP